MKELFKILVIAVGIAFAASHRAETQPANDNFADAQTLFGNSPTVPGDNTDATIEPGEYTGTNGIVLGASVWYQWTPFTNGVVYLSGSASNFTMNIQAFRGDTVSSLSNALEIVDGGYPVLPGQTLFISVASVVSTNGT